jgi:hypothetical protein
MAPRLADLWVDKSTIGKVSYETVSYEPYQPVYYSSFEEKLEAIAAVGKDGFSSYAVTLDEGEDVPDDESLIETANLELKKLYENGILPEDIQIKTLEERRFKQAYLLPDLCYFVLTAPYFSGEVTLCMDSTFYKIYYITFDTEYADGLDAAQIWWDDIIEEQGKSMAEAWYRYWELKDAVLEEETPVDLTDSYAISVYGTGEYMLRFPSEDTLTIQYNMENYISYGRKGGWYMASGLQEMMK